MPWKLQMPVFLHKLLIYRAVKVRNALLPIEQLSKEALEKLQKTYI